MAENDERLRYDAALELRGESAAGSADRWLKGARAFMSETGSSLDPESRKDFERRATYLIQGKYENLKRHEAREVRAGRIARLETETADSAAREANDILMQTQSLENSLGGETRLAGLVRDDALKAAGDDKEKQKAAEDAYAQRMGGLFLRRKADSERLIVQIGATTMMNEDRFQNAVDQGLFDQPTADALRRKYQRTVMDTTVGTLLQGGQADQAEAFVAALEDNDRALALSMGYTPEDVAKMRSGVEAVRAKRTADAERAKEEATKRAQDAARETEIEMALATVPDDEKARAAHYAAMATQYRTMAQDKALDAETRLQYANAAARLSAPKGGKSAANAPRPGGEADSIYDRAVRLMKLRKDRQIGDEDFRRAQAEIYRDYSAALREGTVDAAGLKKIDTELDAIASADMGEAMDYIFDLFSYTMNEDKRNPGEDVRAPYVSGKHTAESLDKDKSRDVKFYSNELVDRGVVWDSRIELKPQEMFELLASARRTLSTAERGTSRLQMVKDAAVELKRRKTFENNRDLVDRMAEELMKSQMRQMGQMVTEESEDGK